MLLFGGHQDIFTEVQDRMSLGSTEVHSYTTPTHTHRETDTNRQTDRQTTVDSSEDRKRIDSFHVVCVYHYVEHPPQGTLPQYWSRRQPWRLCVILLVTWQYLSWCQLCYSLYVAVCGLAFDLTIPVVLWRQPSYLAVCANMKTLQSFSYSLPHSLVSSSLSSSPL